MREAIAQLDGEIAGLRSLITKLRPAALDQLGVAAALEALAERTALRGMEVDLDVDLAWEAGREPDRLPAEVETAVYRIVQESLTNAHKHGGATRAAVEVHESGSSMRLSVRDDGSGFDPQAGTGGFGLVGMAERVDLLEGTVDVRSAPGAGTTIAVTLPTGRTSEPLAYGRAAG